jgi:hypothetical protein
MHDDTAYYKENHLVNQVQEIFNEMISRALRGAARPPIVQKVAAKQPKHDY